MLDMSEKLNQVLQDVPKVYHAGQLDIVKNAGCLKGSKSGFAMLIDDVSPVEHTMSVRVHGKNLLPPADSGIYYKGSIKGGDPFIAYSSYGISDFSNLDVSSYRGVYAVIKLTEGKTYTLTINNLVNNCATKQIFLTVGFRSSESTVFGTSETSNRVTSSTYNPSSFTFTVPSGYPYCLVGFYNYPTVSGDTVSFNAMQLELGTKATDYEPYNSDIQNVHSKNLIPYPYAETTKTENGITFTVNSSGSVTVNGTATAQAYFYLFRNKTIKAGTYTISGCPSGGGSYIYKILAIITASDGTKSYWGDFGNSTPNTFTEDVTIDLRIQIENEQVVKNLVFKPQLEYGKTATAYTKYHEPYPLVVSKYGKNLWDKDYASSLSNWYILPNGAGYCKITIKIPKGTQYTVSYQKKLSTGLGFYFYINNGQTNWMYHSSQAGLIKNTITLTDSQGFIDVVMGGYPSLKKFMENIGNDLQIEISPTATAYEPYTSKTDYTPNSDGTVEGVESLYPSTTLLTNDPYGKVYIDCGYYKDIDKTFNELTTSVALSGGE